MLPARSLRDSWSGSYILAWLTFHAMKEIIKDLGPTAIIFPSLRGAPLLDQWLKEEFNLEKPGLNLSDEECRMPSLPNRFLAVVPYGPGGETARDFAIRCEQAARNAWKELSGSVRSTLNSKWSFLKACPDWDKHWDDQIDQYFDTVSTVLGIRDSDNTALDALLGNSKLEADRSSSIHSTWPDLVDLAGRLQSARRAVRHVPVLDNKGGDVPPKCSLFGSFEQMGPAGLDESRKFWQQAENKGLRGVHLRSQERFSALALTKRFAWPAFFDAMGNNQQTFRYPDTASVAATEWLEIAGIDPEFWWDTERTWSGQWLYWADKNPDNKDEDSIPDRLWDQIRQARKSHGTPPGYLAVLMLDGDRMGHWLQGKNSPIIRDIIHPDLVGADLTEDILDSKRPVSPALHSAISEALTNYSLFVAPEIVKKHKGVLVYAGGDDVFAMLPTTTAVQCAKELNDAFCGPENGYYPSETHGNLLMMGGKASTSAGIAIVHYKEDLRYALQQARSAEKQAKNAGRSALALQICKRSGEHVSSVIPWEYADTFSGWVTSFIGTDTDAASSTDRWAYTLRSELHAFKENWDMFAAETRRLLGRAKDSLHGNLTPDNVMKALSDYKASMDQKALKIDEESGETRLDYVMKSFVTLVQSASFLARGRDR